MKLTLQQEQEMVKGCLAGDRYAWDFFVDTYNRLIYACIHKTLKTYGFYAEATVVSDLFQDVFHSLLNEDCAKLRKFGWKNDSSLSTWLAVMTRNLVVDYIRSQGKKSKLTDSIDIYTEIEGCGKQLKAFIDREKTVVERLTEKEVVVLIKEVVEGLSESDRHLAELLLFQEMTYSEIAKILKKSKDVLYMQKKRLFEKMQKRIEDSVRF